YTVRGDLVLPWSLHLCFLMVLTIITSVLGIKLRLHGHGSRPMSVPCAAYFQVSIPQILTSEVGTHSSPQRQDPRRSSCLQ
ncbi:hypothetical protein J6590_090772, partial [Homalodisca vitripennis]